MKAFLNIFVACVALGLFAFVGVLFFGEPTSAEIHDKQKAMNDTFSHAIYLCPKHGELGSCLSFYISEGDNIDYCALCLREVIDKAGVHQVVLK